MNIKVPEMKVDYKEFIGIYRNVFPEDYCEHLVTEFERLCESGAGSNRQRSENTPKHRKDDMQVGLNMGIHTVSPFSEQSTESIFFKGLQRCYDDYTERFSILKEEEIKGTAMKMQRTDPGGGYHIWHSEQGRGKDAERVLVYALYLNDFSEHEGGETEFLYQKLRIKPEKNLLLIWPAAFTHVHRGNTVLGSQAKYIVTGWFYYD